MKTRLMIVIAIIMLALPAAALAGGEIKIALDCPPDAAKCGTYVWSQAFGDSLKAAGLKIKYFQRDALGGEEEKLDQVSQGLLEVSNSDLAKAGQLDQTIFGFYLPYLFDGMAHMDRVLAKTDIMAKINAGTTKKGVRVLAIIPVGGFSGLANTKHPVKTPADLKDLRMRALDKKQVKILETWGTSAVIIPWAEIYNSLQTGVADGYLNAAIVPVMFKHTDVLKYYSDLKFAAPLRISICSEDWYQGLSKDDRAKVDAAVVAADKANRAWQAKIEQGGLDALKKAGVTIYMNTAEERAQFAKPLQAIYKDLVPPAVAELFIKAAEATR